MTLIIATLVLGFWEAAEAQHVRPRVNLAPGGQTIGGPGALTLHSPDTDVIFRVPFQEVVDICVTVVNFSHTNPVSASFRNNQGAVIHSGGAGPRTTRSSCARDVRDVLLGCSEDEDDGIPPGECGILWRIDRYPEGRPAEGV